MTRRDLLRSAASLLAAGAALPPVLRPQSLLRMTPADSEQFLPCHLGYLPGARKLLLFRASAPQRQVLVHVLRNSECVATHSVKSASFDFGPLAVLDLSSIARPARYQLTAGNQETSVQFNIDPEIWPKTLPVITGYHRYQRCGAAIPGVRPACHLDDGRRRDTGTHVDAVGGWHDAGDTRKWTDATLMNLFGLLAILRGRGNAVDNRNDPEFKRLLGEVRHGNAFFLKMQDADGLVWADVAGGVNGDNSDNRWTDNRPRTADDRWINTQKRTDVQAMFVAAESICAQVFQTIAPVYAQACLQAARRCWNASERSYNRTTDLAWWILAAVEFFAAAPDNSIYQAIIQLANQLRRFQFTRFEGNQDFVRGFFPMWPGNGEPLRDPVHSALPAYALLRAGMALPRNPEAGRGSAPPDCTSTGT